MNAHPEVSEQLELLASRMAALEQRVAALENTPQSITEPVENLAPRAEFVEVATLATAETSPAKPVTSAFSLIGIALLGIAGAYVLRAIYGAGLLPHWLAAGVASAYAAVWFVAAARTFQRLAAALYVTTSILILAPMLWEISIRFQAMPAMGAAGLLVTYTGFVTAIGFRPAQSTALTVAWCGSALTAAALAVGTHDLAPFAAILLVMHGVCELTPLCGRTSGARFLVAVCADFSAWSLVRVYPLAAGEHGVYPALSSAIVLSALALLFAIQVAALAIRTVRRTQPIGTLRILQVLIVFALLVFGIHENVLASAARVNGLLCLLLAIAGYAAGYGRFRSSAQTRNFRVFVAWSFCLSIAAAFLLVSGTAASMILAAIAPAAIALARRMQSTTIEAQGVAFICIASAASNLLEYIVRSLAGDVPGTPSWRVILVAACALVAYAVSSERRGAPPMQQVLHLIPAFLAAFAVAAFLARGMIALASLAFTPAEFQIAALRTSALCVLALVLAFVGAWLGRAQTIRVAYAALAFATIKLLFEDLRHGRMEFIALSIVLVAIGFLGVPRLARMARLH